MVYDDMFRSDSTIFRSLRAVAYPGFLCVCVGGGGSANSVEDRENGDLEAVAPSQGFWRQL